MMRVAVIGVGSMGRNHVRVYTEMPEVELVAVVDANPTAGEQIAHRYHVPYYTDVCEMLEKERPEAVSVAVPTSLHYSVAKQLLEAARGQVASSITDLDVRRTGAGETCCSPPLLSSQMREVR